MPRPSLLLAVLALLPACELAQSLRRADAHLASGDTVQLDSVIKGDEVVVEKDGAQFRVRMLGIAALDPVINDPLLEKYGKAAEAFLQGYAQKPLQVFFEGTNKDAHGRFLAYLHTQDADLNRQMVQSGLVTAYTEYPFEREQAYLQAEGGARKQKLGLWQDDKAAPLVTGLRKQWRTARQGRGEAVVSDPLL